MDNQLTTIAGVESPRFWDVASVDGDTAEIRFYGDVVHKQPIDFWTGEPEPGDYISPEGFREDLATISGAKTINIYINSLGGDTFTALAIHNELKRINGRKIVTVDGIAASAGSILAMAGDEIRMHPGSLMMIHCNACLVMDYINAADIKKISRGLEAADKAVAAIYAKKAQLATAHVLTMMEKETWMTGDEAKAKGFCDTVIGGDQGAPSFGLTANAKILMVNGVQHNAQGITIPERFNIPQLAASAIAPAKNIKKQEAKEMTIEELRAQAPELCAQIADEAIKAERERLQAIDSIAMTIGDTALLNAARYENPMTAAELALKAMQNAAKRGEQFMQARAKETEPAAAVPAAAAPVDDPADLEAATAKKEQEVIDNAVKALKSLR